MINRLKELQLCWMLLTRLPAGTLRDPVPKTADAAWAFPIVGLGIGVLMWAAWSLAISLGLPALPAAILALAVQTLLTGGMHEDGLADMADGFGGGQTRERKLEIMRDSRIGSYGVLALILTLALTASAIAESAGFIAFVGIAVLSRTAMLLPMAMLPPARADGLGKGAATRFEMPVLVALALAAGLGLFVLPTMLVMIVITITLIGLFRKQIGGQTGDTLGATQKLTECAGWLVLAAATA